MNGKDYEKMAAGYLRSHGFRRVKITGRSADYGVDIVATKRRHRYAVQCKFYSKPVGVAAVQQVVGGMAYYNCDKAMVITNNTFTRQARELARMDEVMLLENIKSSGRLRRALLMVLYYLLWILLLVMGHTVIALTGIFASLLVTVFILYLRHSAIRNIRSSEQSTEAEEIPEDISPRQQTGSTGYRI